MIIYHVTYALFLKEKIINRTINEVSSLGTLYGLAPVMIVINVIMFIVALVVLSIIDFRQLLRALLKTQNLEIF